jgi:hypothetical protein
MPQSINSGASLLIVKNEKLLCLNCLNSGAGPVEEAVYCYLNPTAEVKQKSQFCAQGLWLIDGEVLEFKQAFQKVYDKSEKEVKTQE